MPLAIRLTHKDWETMGSHSLEGIIISRCPPLLVDTFLCQDAEIILEIEQTSFSYRDEEHGPLQMIIPEFVPLCLIESIISLMQKGLKITVKEISVDFPNE